MTPDGHGGVQVVQADTIGAPVQIPELAVAPDEQKLEFQLAEGPAHALLDGLPNAGEVVVFFVHGCTPIQ